MTAHVESYSGYKADERPIRFDWSGRLLTVTRILRQWREPREACFHVLADDGLEYILRCRDCLVEAVGEWTVDPVAISG